MFTIARCLSPSAFASSAALLPVSVAVWFSQHLQSLQCFASSQGGVCHPLVLLAVSPLQSGVCHRLV